MPLFGDGGSLCVSSRPVHEAGDRRGDRPPSIAATTCRNRLLGKGHQCPGAASFRSAAHDARAKSVGAPLVATQSSHPIFAWLFFFTEKNESCQKCDCVSATCTSRKVAATTSCASRSEKATALAAEQEEATPSAVPSGPDAASQRSHFRTGLFHWLNPEEIFRILRPLASDFARDHHPYTSVRPLDWCRSSLCSCVLPTGRLPLFCQRSLGSSHPNGDPTPMWRRGLTGWSRRVTAIQPQHGVSSCRFVGKCTRSKSRSRKQMFESRAHLFDSRPPLSNMQLCDGQNGQDGGHKSNDGQIGARADGDGARGQVQNPSGKHNELAMLSAGQTQVDHCENEQGSVWATRQSHGNVRGICRTPPASVLWLCRSTVSWSLVSAGDLVQRTRKC